MVTAWDCFRKLRIELDELEAREIIAFAVGLDAGRMIDWKTYVLSSGQQEHIAQLLARRRKGEPLAYLLGEWDFYGNRFFVTPDVLIPRGDTEWLCDAAVQAAKKLYKPKILDLCCGSGCIGISIALAVPDACVTAIDCSKEALAVTQRNAELYQLKEPAFTILQADALQPDCIDTIFDIVVSNPPYITAQEMLILDHSVEAYEPHLALFGGEDGLDFYRSMAQAPAFRLREGGMLFAECGWKQGKQAAELFIAAGWKNVRLQNDLAGIPRIIYAQKSGG